MNEGVIKILQPV